MPAAGKRHLYAVTVAEFNELARYVYAPLLFGLIRNQRVMLPAPACRVGIGCCGRGVCQPRCADNARLEAGLLRALQQCGQRLGERARTIIGLNARVDVEHQEPPVMAGHDGRGGAGAVGYLAVDGEGLHEGHVRKGLKGQHVVFAFAARQLAGVDSGGGDGGNAHAITQKQDDVARLCRDTGAGDEHQQ